MSVFFDTAFGGVKKLTCLWVAVLATTTLGRHVENRLKVDKHGSGFLIFSYGVEEKSPYRVGHHVLNVRPKKGVNLGTER